MLIMMKKVWLTRERWMAGVSVTGARLHDGGWRNLLVWIATATTLLVFLLGVGSFAWVSISPALLVGGRRKWHNEFLHV